MLNDLRFYWRPSWVKWHWTLTAVEYRLGFRLNQMLGYVLSQSRCFIGWHRSHSILLFLCNINLSFNSGIWNLFSGTCINNTSVMMFKKGSFEIEGTIYPVAIKVNWERFPQLWLSFIYLVWISGTRVCFVAKQRGKAQCDKNGTWFRAVLNKMCGNICFVK